MRRLAVAVAVLVTVLLPGAPAWAHNRLLSSEPSAGVVLSSAPRTVSLRFAERLNPDFTTIVVSDAARQRVPAGDPAVDGGTGAVTLAGEPANGAYTVAYRVVSTDGHAVQGSYPFIVDDPAKPAAASLAVTAAKPGGPSVALLGALGVAVLGLGLVAFLVLARKSAGTNRRSRPTNASTPDHSP